MIKHLLRLSTRPFYHSFKHFQPLIFSKAYTSTAVEQQQQPTNIFWKEEELEVTLHDEMDNDMMYFLTTSFHGSEFACTHRNVDIRPHIDFIKVFNAQILVLKELGDIVGMSILVKKSAKFFGKNYPCLVNTHFVVNKEEEKAKYFENVLHLLTAKYATEHFQETKEDDGVYYTFLDTENYFAQIPLPHLYESTFSSFYFHRMFRRKNTNVEKCEDLNLLQNLLEDFYKNSTFVDLENSLQLGNYFVLKNEKGEIICGAQVDPTCFKRITTAPPNFGWGHVLGPIISRIPFLNKFLNLNKFRPIRLSNLYVKKGHEKDFEKLLSHLLKEFKRHSAILFLDNRSKLFADLKRKIRFGYGFFGGRQNTYRIYTTKSIKPNEIYVSPIDVYNLI